MELLDPLSRQSTHIREFIKCEATPDNQITIGHYSDPSKLLAFPNKVKLFEDKETLIFTKPKKITSPATDSSNKTKCEAPLPKKKDKRNLGHRKAVEPSKLTAFPYTAILRVMVEFTDPKSKTKKSEESGSCFLVGPRHVLTAAHVIYHRDWEVWSNYIYVTSPEYKEKKIYVLRAYKYMFSECDLALLVLDQDIGNSIGWFGMAHYSEVGALELKEANLTGYPAHYKGEMLTAKGTLFDCDEEDLKFTIDGSYGQSGSPIWIEDSNGVLAVGNFTYHTISGDKYRGGERFSRRRLETIVEYIRETYSIVETSVKSKADTEKELHH